MEKHLDKVITAQVDSALQAHVEKLFTAQLDIRLQAQMEKHIEKLKAAQHDSAL